MVEDRVPRSWGGTTLRSSKLDRPAERTLVTKGAHLLHLCQASKRPTQNENKKGCDSSPKRHTSWVSTAIILAQLPLVIRKKSREGVGEGEGGRGFTHSVLQLAPTYGFVFAWWVVPNGILLLCRNTQLILKMRTLNSSVTQGRPRHSLKTLRLIIRVQSFPKKSIPSKH